jgi:LacI family transcriptional regulator
VATINDVSRRAGVSRATVSRVIAGNGYVSDAKRRLIEEAIAALGYRPNTMARGLRSNRSNIIGAVVVDVSSPFYAQMVGGMQKGAKLSGRSVLSTSGHAQAEAEAHAIVELLDRACDGLILYLENPLRTDVVELLRASGLPVVSIGGNECPAATVKIHIDNFAGARAAMRLVLEQGHRAISYLSGGLMYRDTHERLRGMAAALGEHNLSLDDITIVHGDFDESFGFEGTLELIASGRPLTALFAGDDDVAAGALLALKQSGRRVPDDISLVGFDDNFHARHLTPGLTTVRQPVDEVGRVATELLARILSGDTSHPVEITVPTTLVVRQSVGPVPRPGKPKPRTKESAELLR